MKKIKKKIYCFLSTLLALGNYGAIAKEQTPRSKSQQVKSKSSKNSKDIVTPLAITGALFVTGVDAFKSAKEIWKNRNNKIKYYIPPEKPKKPDIPDNPPPQPPLPKLKTAESVTEVIPYNGDLEFSPVQGAGSCFLSALCSLWYNPKSAKNGVYKKYSAFSIDDIDEEIKKCFEGLKNQYGNLYYNEEKIKFDAKINLEYMKKYNAEIQLDPYDISKSKRINDATNEEIENYEKIVQNEHNFKKKLMYASIINRSKFYNESYDAVKKNNQCKDVFMSFRDATFNIKQENVEIGSNVYTLNRNVSGHTDPIEKNRVINEQLFCGTWYNEGKIIDDNGNKPIYEYPRSGGDGDAGAVLSQDSQLGPLGFCCDHNPNISLSNRLLEPDAMYISYRNHDKNDNFKKIKISEKPRQPKKMLNGEIERDSDGDVVWDGNEYQTLADISENGEIYEPISKKEYVLVAIETVTGGHCTAQKLKFYKNSDNSSITLAGWLHHECIGKSKAQLHLVKNDEKLTAQQILKFRDKCAGLNDKSGLILKFVPKQDILDYPEYYCVNQYKK